MMQIPPILTPAAATLTVGASLTTGADFGCTLFETARRHPTATTIADVLVERVSESLEALEAWRLR